MQPGPALRAGLHRGCAGCRAECPCDRIAHRSSRGPLPVAAGPRRAGRPGDPTTTPGCTDHNPALGRPAIRHPALRVLRLGQSVDDTAWAPSHDGRLYATDNGAGTVDVITGPFPPGSVFEAVTPCDANGAPATCPGPGFPGQLRGRAEPEDRAHQPGAGGRCGAAAAGPVVHPGGGRRSARPLSPASGREHVTDACRGYLWYVAPLCHHRERYRMFIRMSRILLDYSIVCSCSSVSSLRSAIRAGR